MMKELKNELVWGMILLLSMSVYVFSMGLHSIDTAFNLISTGSKGDVLLFSESIADPISVYRQGLQGAVIGFIGIIFSLSVLGVLKWNVK